MFSFNDTKQVLMPITKADVQVLRTHAHRIQTHNKIHKIVTVFAVKSSESLMSNHDAIFLLYYVYVSVDYNETLSADLCDSCCFYNKNNGTLSFAVLLYSKTNSHCVSV